MGETARDFIDHWRWAASEGHTDTVTASGLQTACRGVLGVQKDWESLEIAALDAEALLDRFRRVRQDDLAAITLREYERRFRQALASYRSFLKDRMNWKFPVRKSGRRRGTTFQPKQTDKDGLVTYPFPLRDGLIARVVLPVDLRTGEAKRLGAFVQSLAIDSELSDN